MTGHIRHPGLILTMPALTLTPTLYFFKSVTKHAIVHICGIQLAKGHTLHKQLTALALCTGCYMLLHKNHTFINSVPLTRSFPTFAVSLFEKGAVSE